MIPRKSLTIGLFLAALFAGTCVHAYELATHASMTHAARNQSVELNSAQLYKNLGIYPIVINHPYGQFTNNPFGDSYYDVSGNTINIRQADPNGVEFDGRFLGLPREERLSLPAWLMRGAIREDDWTDINVLGCQLLAPNPREDDIDRPSNHFYDPVFDRPLRVLGIDLGQRAPDWAIGSRDAFGAANDPDATRRNHFTVFDAREAMYRALTGKTKEGKDAGPGGIEAKDEHRKAYWATTFRALGDVVHLVQDMGQPQHTRSVLALNECERSLA